MFMSLGEKEMGDLSPVRAGRHLTLRGLLQEQLDPRLSMKTRRLAWQFSGFVALTAQTINRVSTFRPLTVPFQCLTMSDSPTRARVVQTIAGLHTPGLYEFGCDPCEKAKLNTPKGNKQCLYYKDKRKASNPDKDPVSKWEKDVTEQECADLAAADEKVETYWCEEGGGPPKGEVCPPKKTYSYNFETMQPTNSPTPQG